MNDFVIVGAGQAGRRAAEVLRERAPDAQPADRLLKRSMPPVVGAFMHALHGRHGVEMRVGTAIERVHALSDGRTIVETSNGPIEADVVVAGIGVVPNTELAQAAGLEVDDGIVVDTHCRTSDPDIFAAGEVTRHFIAGLGRHVRVESWQVAQKQPAVAAANMLGAAEHYGELPWLWSDQYDCNVQSLGIFDPEHAIVRRGDFARASFTLMGLNADGCLRAAVTVNNGREMAALMRLVDAGPLDASMLANASVSLRALIPR